MSAVKKVKLYIPQYAPEIRAKRIIKGQENIFKAVFWISCIVHVNGGGGGEELHPNSRWTQQAF